MKLIDQIISSLETRPGEWEHIGDNWWHEAYYRNERTQVRIKFNPYFEVSIPLRGTVTPNMIDRWRIRRAIRAWKLRTYRRERSETEPEGADND